MARHAAVRYRSNQSQADAGHRPATWTSPRTRSHGSLLLNGGSNFLEDSKWTHCLRLSFFICSVHARLWTAFPCGVLQVTLFLFSPPTLPRILILHFFIFYSVLTTLSPARRQRHPVQLAVSWRLTHSETFPCQTVASALRCSFSPVLLAQSPSASAPSVLKL